MTKNLGFEYKEVIDIRECSTLKELQEAIEAFVACADNVDPSLICIEDGAGENVSLRLIKHTLTDGSIVYDARLS
jgi:hypothetical protein